MPRRPRIAKRNPPAALACSAPGRQTAGMVPLHRRMLLVEVLALIARLEDEPPDEPSGARQAGRLLAEGLDLDALAALRTAASARLVTAGWLLESYLIDADQD